MTKITIDELVKNTKYAVRRNIESVGNYIVYLACEKLGIPTSIDMQIEKQIAALSEKGAVASTADKSFALQMALGTKYPEVARELMKMIHAYDTAVNIESELSVKSKKTFSSLYTCKTFSPNYEQKEAEIQAKMGELRDFVRKKYDKNDIDVKEIIKRLQFKISHYLNDLTKQGPEYRCMVRTITPHIPFDTKTYISAIRSSR